MDEAKKVLMFYLKKNPWYSIAGAKRMLSLCIGGDLGKQIGRTALSRAEISRGSRIPKAQLPSAETQSKILQVIREANSVYTLDIGKLLATGIIF
jgi:hypothetical protein